MRVSLVLASAVVSLLFSISACSQDTSGKGNKAVDYKEGVHYTELAQAVPVDDPKKIEVTEVFWYGCSHCFTFEPQLVQWKKTIPDDVNLVRMPAMWNKTMEMHGRIFYTAKALGVLENAHQGIFNAINLDRKRLTNPQEIADLLATFGADRDKVLKTIDSFGITSQLKRADAKARGYQISGTPQLIVDGRYRVESNGNLSQADMLKVVDFLVAKVRKERG